MKQIELARYIDHTNLKPDATADDIRKLCQEARAYHFAAVCVHPVYVHLTHLLLAAENTKVCTVVGFPLGSSTTATKVFEAVNAIELGAVEIDMVLHVGGLKSGENKAVLEDIKRVVAACHERQAICKVIIETAILTHDEKLRACELVRGGGADYIKTSTGFGPGGATVEDVSLLANTLSGSDVRVKAAGGIRSYEDAVKMIDAGAHRLGTSSGVKIMEAVAG